MSTKQSIDQSEAAIALEIMSRTDDWAVIVALVGEGQEINTGEAGIGSWLSAVHQRGDWDVVVSPHVGHELPHVRTSSDLHLEVGVRAPRAEALAGWVDAVLDGDPTRAQQSAPDFDDFPILLTRDLEQMRAYLRDRASADRRPGLLASAQARRLRAFGIEMSSAFQGGIDWPRWFVEPAGDVQSSYSLEVAASEFKCQGLEIDWVGLCWGNDYLWSGTSWEPRRMRGSKWVRDADHTHATNRYRVLLTRARYGLAIWVPKPATQTLLIDGEGLNRTARYLEECGAKPMETELV